MYRRNVDQSDSKSTDANGGFDDLPVERGERVAQDADDKVGLWHCAAETQQKDHHEETDCEQL